MPDEKHETTILDLNKPDIELIDPTIEQVRDMLINTKREDVIKLAGAFFNSTNISKTTSWDVVQHTDPKTTLFFVGGTFRVILMLRSMLFKAKKKESTDEQPSA